MSIVFYTLALIGIVICAPLMAKAEDWLNLGPAYDQFPTVLAPGERTEAAGPFYYRQQQDTMKIWALPPILSYSRDPGPELTEFNFAYPVFSYIRYGQQYRLQLFQLLSFAGGPSQTEERRNRFTLFPLYFQQRSSDPNENYTAYGPFYGHLKGRLMRDEIHYIMFPLYSETRKKDVVTDNYVYPFFHLRHGNGLSGWQFWPLFGHEHKDVTSTTNSWGDAEVVPGHERWFALWPIFADQHAGIGTTNVQHQQAVLPLYTFMRSPNRDATTVIWPFFTHIDDREKGYTEWQAPFPFIDFASGTKTIHRVWPFYSHAYSTNLQSDFYMWPVYRYNRLHTESIDRRRTRIAYFLYSDLHEQNLETGKDRRRRDFWPLFDWRKEYNGNRRLQILALLEPIFPENHNIELEYSQVWSLWRNERNEKTGDASQSLLWNLYRHESRSQKRTSQTSLLFGLFQTRKDETGRQTRLFFIPLSRKHASANDQPPRAVPVPGNFDESLFTPGK